MDEVTIALDPRLGLDPAELCAAWNAGAGSAAIGSARPAPAGSATFHDPTLTAVLVGVAVGVGAQVFAQALYDLLKQRINPDRPPTFEVIPIEQPDGSHIYVVKPRS